jgi:DNA processing protein
VRPTGPDLWSVGLRAAPGACMTLDQAAALSMMFDLSRHGLMARARAADPDLLDRAGMFAVRAREVRLAALQAGTFLLPWNDSRFPASLLAISDCPPALWYRGDLAALAAPLVAIVGSRAATAVAREAATRLGADLAAAGVTVVSGLARGVDSAAHRGALRGGRTIAVLGSGSDRIYPHEHVGLAEAISRTGLVLTEYPPGTPPNAFHFPQRNRLISGLSRAVVVIEASEQSGSLITAACALEQGRDVMAVPGNVLSGRNRGGHALIRDGATIVETAGDILRELGLAPEVSGTNGTGSGKAAQGVVTAALSATSGDPVIRVMDEGQAYDFDALVAASGLDGTRLLPRLLDLEIEGRVLRIGGGRFMRSA